MTPRGSFVRSTPKPTVSLGKYRNKYTDAVEFKVRTTANTNVVYFNGKLLALKEDAPPYAIDPQTLETHGLYTFDGQLPSLTFTAHPKFDPKTGDMICFGYEAKGDGTPDVCYYRIGPDGKFLEVVWLCAPVVAMIHDFAVTDNWVSTPLSDANDHGSVLSRDHCYCRSFSLSSRSFATLSG